MSVVDISTIIGSRCFFYGFTGVFMKLEVLVSCMNENSLELVQHINITTDVLIIVQCNRNERQVKALSNQQVKTIYTTDRGLSNSRNLAIQHASGDICLLCDDDERFYPDYDKTIISAFQTLTDADIILFDFDGFPCKLKKQIHCLSYFELLHAASIQISFRRESIVASGVTFDPFMEAGSGNGAQEENKFLMDC